MKRMFQAFFGINSFVSMSGNKYLKRLMIKGMYYIVPMLALSGIWASEIGHYYVPNAVITDEMVNTACRLPSDSSLKELEIFDVLPLRSLWKNDKDLVAAAENILQGNVEIPGFPPVKIRMPFDEDDMEKGSPSWQLHLAGFTVPKILLEAYQITGRDDFLMTARDVILAWALYERNTWFPKSFLWNDHAIAARILVLGEFWRFYRKHPAYQIDAAKDIFQLVSRSGQLLAKPSHFTFPTNHGVIQNLALWHICIAFPSIPNREQYKQLALERMLDQMTFYINDEGIVLEHSAGYHKLGLELLSMVCRYLTMLNMAIPDNWKVKFSKAKEFYAQLRHPDGSLPMLGDTCNQTDTRGPLITDTDAYGQSKCLYYCNNWRPQQSNSLYPIAGYSIWWNGLEEWPNDQKLSQTVMSWANFKGHGHKHADEMSVLLWAGGQTWWTNVGYWPYGIPGRSEAESWSGSNAPHLVNENRNSIRHTGLRSYGWSDKLAIIDLERRGPGEYRAIRQVINLKPNVWIIMDHTNGNEQSLTTTSWTTSHNVELRKGEIPGSYSLISEGINNVTVTAFFLASPGTTMNQYTGSMKPFAGWEGNYYYHSPAPAIVVEQPANNSWMAAIWSISNGIDKASEVTGQPYMKYWKNSEDWKVVIPLQSGSIDIWRKGEEVFADTGEDALAEVMLSNPPESSDKTAMIRAGYENAAQKYPKFKSALSSRLKVPHFLIAIFLFQEAFFFVYKKRGSKYLVNVRIFVMIGWVFMGIWSCTNFLK